MEKIDMGISCRMLNIELNNGKFKNSGYERKLPCNDCGSFEKIYNHFLKFHYRRCSSHVIMQFLLIFLMLQARSFYDINLHSNLYLGIALCIN